MTEPVETFVSLYDRTYWARLVDGHLVELRLAHGDDPATQAERTADVLNAALERHAADTSKAFDISVDPELDQLLKAARESLERAMQMSPSLRRAVEAAQPKGPTHVGASESGSVRVTVSGGRVVDIELAATALQQREQELVQAVDEALQAAWAAGSADTETRMQEFAATFSREALDQEAQELKRQMQERRRPW